MIVYPVYMVYDQWSCCLVATATFSFEKGLFQMTTWKSLKQYDVIWYKGCLVRATQNSYNYGGLPLGLVAMATES